jgi:hypothetical protein
VNITRISALIGLMVLGATPFAAAADTAPATSIMGASTSAKLQPTKMGSSMMLGSHGLLATQNASSKKLRPKGLMTASGPKTKNVKKS